MTGNRVLYSLFMLVASFVVAWMVRSRLKSMRSDMSLEQRVVVAASGFVGATFFAKLPWVLVAFFDFFRSVDIAASSPAGPMGVWLADGKTILWALAGGYVGVEFGKWVMGVSSSTGDVFAIPVAIGVGIGRLGCLFYGCCYGVETTLPWGVCFLTAPDGGTVSRHPAQIYEMLFHFSIALIFWYYERQTQSATKTSTATESPGILHHNAMPAYLTLYAVFRLISETWRPEPVFYLGLTFYQWSSLVLVLCFASVWLTRYQNGRRKTSVDVLG